VKQPFFSFKLIVVEKWPQRGFFLEISSASDMATVPRHFVAAAQAAKVI
jgi:hypothetical protein